MIYRNPVLFVCQSDGKKNNTNTSLKNLDSRTNVRFYSELRERFRFTPQIFKVFSELDG